MEQNKHHYFAYGSNLNLNELKTWCDKNGYEAPITRPLGRGYLPDMDLAFGYRSMSRRSGALNIIPRRGQVVNGVLFEVAPGGWDTLDRKEGAPNYYRRTRLPVLTDDGEMVEATTYDVEPHRREDFVVPKDGYLAVVRAGMKAFGISTESLDVAARGDVSEHLLDAVFVYGTLMRAECRHFAVTEAAGLTCALLAICPGDLFDLGTYPAMTRPTNDGCWVHGDFLRFDSLSAVLGVLDEIEGFRGWSDSSNLFERRLVAVDVGDGRIRHAWTYMLVDPPPGRQPIDSGDWRAHRGRREQFVWSLVNEHCEGRDRLIAEQIANLDPWISAANRENIVSSLLPLEDAILQDRLSERRLAQVTGKWAVVPKTPQRTADPRQD